MPHLKTLELHGYKTFASKTRFEFAEGITAIVGPNGSGKSNIADSIRWVLGEQSYGLLRGKKTEDMIFAGSEQRPRAGMASALITFDNADGGLPIEFSEVSVGRTAYRDGGNEYFLNDQRVRLKDIDELLARCGLSERTYTIIGQGLVDSALSLKPEERRRLFEEAAGIGLYRSRRDESIRRLESTKRNLERVLDILAELQPRVKSLERQAKRASEYDTVRDELKDVLRQWYGYHWHISQEAVQLAHATADTAGIALTGLRETQESNDEKFQELRTNLNAIRAQLNSWHRQASDLHRARETLSRELAVSEERLRLTERSREEASSLLTAAESEQASLEERSAEFETERGRQENDLAEIRRHLEQAEALQANQESERREHTLRRESLRAALQEMEADLARFDARIAQTELRRGELSEREAAVEETIRGLRQAAITHGLEQKDLTVLWEESKTELARVQESLARSGVQVRESMETLEEARARLSESRAQEERLTSRHDVLAQAEKELLGYGGGLRHLIGSAQKGELRGISGALGSQLEVPAEYEAAVTAALGEFQDSVVLQETDSLEQALDLLESSRAGRAGLLALPGLIPLEPFPVPDGHEIIGRASELVRAPAALRPAVDSLLGGTLVVRNRSAARRLLPHLPAHARVVTTAGELFHPAGPVLAGRGEAPASLSRAREMRELEHRFADAAEAVRSAETHLTETEQALRLAHEANEATQHEAAARAQAEQEALRRKEDSRQAHAAKEEEIRWQESRLAEIEEERKTLDKEESRITSEAEALRNRMQTAQGELKEAERLLLEYSLAEAGQDRQHWQTKLALADQAQHEMESRRADTTLAFERALRTVEERRGRIQSLEQERNALEQSLHALREEEARLSASIHETQQQIEPAELRLAEFEAEQARLEADESEGRTRLHSSERQYTQAQVDLARRQEELEGLRRRIEDDFGLVEFEYANEVTGPTPLPLTDLVERLPHVESLAPELEDLVNRRRAQLRRMGAINPEAPLEFKEVKERFEFLTTQLTDLRQAETQLREVIAELDVMMKEAFQKTFQAVADEFPRIFTRLFGGGSAKLTLIEGDSAAESGIDITARLPGRRSQGLALLSGGERSLTAVALVFSLLKVSPTPFCVLDEVDAMLDESNVGRFRDLLLELSHRTQFIIVTHNRNTVQAAQVIYGVSMGSDSASQLISLRLDEFVNQ